MSLLFQKLSKIFLVFWIFASFWRSAAAQPAPEGADRYRKYTSLSPNTLGADFSLDVTPTGRFLFTRNLPANKEIFAEASIALKMVDGTWVPYFIGDADFTVAARSRLTGLPLLDPQFYSWTTTPEVVVPLAPPGAPEHSPILTQSPGLFPDPYEQIKQEYADQPQWKRDMVEAVSGYNATAIDGRPLHQLKTQQSEPEKHFYWDLGGIGDLPQSTEVKVKLTEVVGGPAYYQGKVKINWVCPAHTYYTVELSLWDFVDETEAPSADQLDFAARVLRDDQLQKEIARDLAIDAGCLILHVSIESKVGQKLIAHVVTKAAVAAENVLGAVVKSTVKVLQNERAIVDGVEGAVSELRPASIRGKEIRGLIRDGRPVEGLREKLPPNRWAEKPTGVGTWENRAGMENRWEKPGLKPPAVLPEEDTGRGRRRSRIFPTVTMDDADVIEGDSGTKDLVFKVHLNRSVDGKIVSLPASVGYSVTDGSAHEGSDYEAASGVVTFATSTSALQTETIVVKVTGDTQVEDVETLFANFSGARNCDVVKKEAKGTIGDDDGGLFFYTSDPQGFVNSGADRWTYTAGVNNPAWSGGYYFTDVKPATVSGLRNGQLSFALFGHPYTWGSASSIGWVEVKFDSDHKPSPLGAAFGDVVTGSRSVVLSQSDLVGANLFGTNGQIVDQGVVNFQGGTPSVEDIPDALPRDMPADGPKWLDGQRGEGRWQPDDVRALRKAILDGRGQSAIQFHNGYPDFSPFAVYEVALVPIQHGTPGPGNGSAIQFSSHDFDAADEAWALSNGWLVDNVPDIAYARNKRKEYPYLGTNGQEIGKPDLTWHHDIDMKRMQLIPVEINRMRHKGGAFYADNARW